MREERRAYVAAGGYDDKATFDGPIARLEAMVTVLRALKIRFPRRTPMTEMAGSRR